ncbi:radical SAM protein [Streptomyces sp. R11]|uniref:Radical SAM protein n=1 Tax=Streptomyces sp. R11 TaxID=3238625 RepID=A0AB39NEY6_9ACTN
MRSRPSVVVWDITYACPLRCSHCYSESGRRPKRQLDRGDLERVADAIVSLGPEEVAMAGGEPLLVPGMLDAAARIADAGIALSVYTSGWTLRASHIPALVRNFSRIHVSIDGATALVHDRIRGRAGSFERAEKALAVLDEAARCAEETAPWRFGIDWVAVRSNFEQLERMCSEFVPRFPHLAFLHVGAAVPSGLASRPGFAASELLSDAQERLLSDPGFRGRLRDLVPASVRLSTTDNRVLQMRPDQIERGAVMAGMQIEPDGAVRAMPIYEGTVGSLLTDDPAELWRRAVARWSHPVVTRALSGAYTMQAWAQAARRIDRHFGSQEVRDRIDRRPDFTARPAS